MRNRDSQIPPDFFPYAQHQADYLINCSPKIGYVYVEVPKAGSCTIKRILQNIEVDGDASKLLFEPWEREKSPIPKLTKTDLSVFDIFCTGRFFRFSFVRNPFSRVLSCYLDKIVDDIDTRQEMLPKAGLPPNLEPDFYDFLLGVRRHPNADVHWAPQTHLLNYDKIRYDFLGRFENFQNSIDVLVQKLSPSSPKEWLMIREAQHATSATSKVQELVGMKEAELILEIYESDFATLAYSRDPLFAVL